jgi:hypothetical protein
MIFNNPNRHIIKLNESDIDRVVEFCNKCSALGIENNSSLEKMKWQQGKWFAAVDNNEIYSLAGYHKLELDSNSYRVLFRGAQLPNYNPVGMSKNYFKSSVHWSYLLHEQVQEITQHNPNAKLYISTNTHKNTHAPSSYRLTRSIAPLMVKRGLLTLEHEGIELYYTTQNLYRLNVENYLTTRGKFLTSASNL